MMFRRKKHMVRVHLTNGEPSIEGVYMGRVGRHYRVEAARVIEAEDRSYEITGSALIPSERVAFIQVLPA